MENAGPVAAIVAGAMLLAMVTLGQPLEELKQVIETNPSQWQQLIPGLSWPVKLFGISAFTFVASFFSEKVAGGVAAIIIAYWVLHHYNSSGNAIPAGGLTGNSANVGPPHQIPFGGGSQ